MFSASSVVIVIDSDDIVSAICFVVLFEKIETLLIQFIKGWASRVTFILLSSGITLLKSGKFSLIILEIIVLQ